MLIQGAAGRGVDRGAMLIHPAAAIAEKAARSAELATLGHGEDAPSMQRVPEDLHAVGDDGREAEGVRHVVPRTS